MRKLDSRSLRKVGPQHLLKISLKLTSCPLLSPRLLLLLSPGAWPSLLAPPTSVPTPRAGPGPPLLTASQGSPPRPPQAKSPLTPLPAHTGHALRLPVRFRLKARPSAQPPPLAAQVTHSVPTQLPARSPTTPPCASRLPNGQHHSLGRSLGQTGARGGAATLKSPTGLSGLEQRGDSGGMREPEIRCL